jgi:hypothetical protein
MTLSRPAESPSSSESKLVQVLIRFSSKPFPRSLEKASGAPTFFRVPEVLALTKRSDSNTYLLTIPATDFETLALFATQTIGCTIGSSNVLLLLTLRC